MSVPAAEKIREHMDVVCSQGLHVGEVDRVEGDRIKLTRVGSADGRHHYIPTSLVEHVDDRVHLSRPVAEVRRLWSTG